MQRLLDFSLPWIIFLQVWYIVYFNTPVPGIGEPRAHIPPELLPLLPYVPLLGIAAYALYALLNVIWSVVTFRECPEAYEELQKEIKEAQNDLRKKGVDVGKDDKSK